MSINVGSVDRVIRAVVGIALIVYPVFAMITVWGFLIASVGMILLSTAIISECPLYALFGLSTSRHGQERERKQERGHGHAQPHPL